jgi:hypothetical protein
MNRLNNHIAQISSAIGDWLQPDNQTLKRAIDRTVEEGLFGIEDIKHQIRYLKNSLTEENLIKWTKNTNFSDWPLSSKNIVCLHAGNLPLVGLQDLLAVTITGANYTGKLSKKDPYLLPTLIEKLDQKNIGGVRKWSTALSNLAGSRADAVLFAGSEDSVEPVISSLSKFGIATQKTPRLMRTAHFSIAFIEDYSKKTMEDLTEAVFRYGGTGCRSVAIVVAPFSFKSQKCHFTDYIESFWLKNPQLQKPKNSLFYRYATNKALDIEQSWLNDFLIEERLSRPTDKFVLQWIEGDEKTLAEIIEQYRTGLQTVYTQSGELSNNFDSSELPESDLLANAQTPDIWWKPDGVDTLEWLFKNVG